MASPIRVLLLADTHLGFDLPARPRTARRRRGHDFLANYATALAPALHGEVDVVVHGGDVFDRAAVPPDVAWQGLEPLVRIADAGVPVFVVPGNHERSRLPHERFASHPLVHVFDRPRTVRVRVRGSDVAVTGFPSERRAGERFGSLLEASDWRSAPADVRLLCMHQCVEGATVGPGSYTFRAAPDVVRPGDVPAEFAAVLSGHIHRHQVLTRDVRGRPLAAPVLYPGSIERTSTAEAAEPKGWLQVELARGEPVRWEFRHLPARPMLVRDVEATGLSGAELQRTLRGIIAAAPADAVLRIRIRGEVAGPDSAVPSAAQLRRHAPASMNIEVVSEAWSRGYGQRRRGAAAAARPAGDELQLDLT